jgi:hypothetical protein
MGDQSKAPGFTLMSTTERALVAWHHRILVGLAGLQGVLSTTPRSGQFRAVRNDQLIRRAQRCQCSFL